MLVHSVEFVQIYSRQFFLQKIRELVVGTKLYAVFTKFLKKERKFFVFSTLCCGTFMITSCMDDVVWPTKKIETLVATRTS